MLDSHDIRQRIPHRFPHLMVDVVTRLDETSACAEKCISVNEPCIRGHFPSEPVMPGVLIVEAMFQLVWIGWGGEAGLHLRGARRIKFRRAVVPGDRLCLEVSLVEKTPEGMWFRGVARVDDKVAAEGDVLVAPRSLSGRGLNSPDRREPVKA